VGVIKEDALKNDEAEVRSLIGVLVERYHEIFHSGVKAFTPGQTYVPCAGRVYDADEMKLASAAVLDFWLTAGHYAADFERVFAEYQGVDYCVLTNSGSSANLLAVSALTSLKLKDRRLKPGDEVITVAAGFPTTIAPIVQNRLVPVLLDVNLGTYNVKPEQIEQSVSPRTKAIMIAHTLGNPFDLETVMAVAKKHKLWVIEDNCDALGSLYKGKKTGTFGDIVTYSFYPAHHITMGEGGALTTDDPSLRKLILSFRDWGRDCHCDPGQDNACGKRYNWKLGNLPEGYDHKYTYSHLGYNLKVTDIQAAIGLGQLKKLAGFIEIRRRNWEYLTRALRALEDKFILPVATEGSLPSWFGFMLCLREGAGFSRVDLVRFLEEKKIGTRMLFAGNITRQPCFDGVECRVPVELTNTDTVMNNAFWLGVYPGLSMEMLDYVAEQIRMFVRSK
jgi:CDP-6-deoxy-D-xylo-4-hexulose-3-dehydrase